MIRRYHDAGSTTLLHTPLAVLALVFDAVGEHRQAATIFGFVAESASTAHHQKNLDAIAHLRMTLGPETFDSLGRAGAQMTAAQMVTYAFTEIGEAIARLG